MEDKSEHMRILEMIESGKISVEEGLGLLAALEGTPESGEEGPLAPATEVASLSGVIDATRYTAPDAPDLSEPIPPPSPFNDAATGSTSEAPSPAPAAAPEILIEKSGASLPPDAAKWRRWWVIPLWIGVGFTVVGGVLLYAAVQAAGGVNFWFFCAAVPFTLGLLAIILAWQSRTSPWLHLRVQQAPGETPQRIAISLPLPTGLAAWFLRTFGRKIPAMQEQALDEVILAVGKNASPDNPIYIQVDEGEDGEKVEIYIG